MFLCKRAPNLRSLLLCASFGMAGVSCQSILGFQEFEGGSASALDDQDAGDDDDGANVDDDANPDDAREDDDDGSMGVGDACGRFGGWCGACWCCFRSRSSSTTRLTSR